MQCGEKKKKGGGGLHERYQKKNALKKGRRRQCVKKVGEDSVSSSVVRHKRKLVWKVDK